MLWTSTHEVGSCVGGCSGVRLVEEEDVEVDVGCSGVLEEDDEEVDEDDSLLGADDINHRSKG